MLLLLVGLGLAGGNLYETARRSTIPVTLHTTVERIEARPEKHPGVDDVHLIRTRNGTCHVDETLARQLGRGDTLSKEAWSRSLRINEDEIALEFSQDFRGMLVVMPVVTSLLIILIFGHLIRSERVER